MSQGATTELQTDQPDDDEALRVLVVEGREQDREAVSNTLHEAGLCVVEAADGLRGWNHFRREPPHAIVAGFELAGLSGLALLRRVRRVSTVPFVFEASEPDLREAVKAVRAGADDVLCLPDDLERVATKVRSLVDPGPGGVAARIIEARIVGRSAVTARLRERLRAVADLRVPVLFRGEEGSGRDHAVRTVLAAQGIDPEELVVVRPGDARPSPRRGASGIYYLDGVESLPPEEQAHWTERITARDRRVEGAPRRIFASSSADLGTLAHEGRFQPELAQQLGRFAIDLPPLRERLEDVGPLAQDLARRAAARMGRPRVVFTAPAIRLLQRQNWPGNVAELEAMVEKLVAFSPEGQVARRQVATMLRESPASVRSLRRAAERRQREQLLELLDATGGNLAEVARRLELSRGAVIYRAQKFGLMPKPS